MLIINGNTLRYTQKKKSATARQNESIDDIFLENEFERELKELKSSISTDIILLLRYEDSELSFHWTIAKLFLNLYLFR